MPLQRPKLRILDTKTLNSLGKGFSKAISMFGFNSKGKRAYFPENYAHKLTKDDFKLAEKFFEVSKDFLILRIGITDGNVNLQNKLSTKNILLNTVLQDYENKIFNDYDKARETSHKQVVYSMLEDLALIRTAKKIIVNNKKITFNDTYLEEMEAVFSEAAARTKNKQKNR